MANSRGDFIWYELMTDDPAGARAFYGAVLGWQIDAEGGKMPNGSEYRMIRSAEGEDVGGVLTLSPAMAESGARPQWFGYICVEDVDAAVRKVAGAGGQVYMEPTEIEGVGRMAMVTDPQGAPFYLMRGFPNAESKVYRMMETGHVAWNELVTRDVDAAFAFYKDLFGWTEGEEVPMGDAGRYRMFEQQGRSIGGFMSLTEQEMPPMWVFYVAVDDIDAAHAAILANDGKPLHDPQPIPGDMFTVAAQDPQGAMFAVVGKREK